MPSPQHASLRTSAPTNRIALRALFATYPCKIFNIRITVKPFFDLPRCRMFNTEPTSPHGISAADPATRPKPGHSTRPLQLLFQIPRFSPAGPIQKHRPSKGRCTPVLRPRAPPPTCCHSLPLPQPTTTADNTNQRRTPADLPLPPLPGSSSFSRPSPSDFPPPLHSPPCAASPASASFCSGSVNVNVTGKPHCVTGPDSP